MFINKRVLGVLTSLVLVVLPMSVWGQSILLQPENSVANFPGEDLSNIFSDDSDKANPNAATQLVSVDATDSRVHIIGNGRLLNYKTLELSNPTRLVIDLDGVAAKSNIVHVHKFKYGGVRLGVHSDKSRVVVDAAGKDLPRYHITQEGNSLTVLFGDQANKVKKAIKRSAKHRSKVSAASLSLVKNKTLSANKYPVSNKRISLDFRDADIRNVLRFMTETSSYNIVAGDELRGRVTIKLKNVRWMDALKAILRVSSLSYSIDGNIIRILPLNALQAEHHTRMATQALEDSTLPLKTRLMRVNYSDAQSWVSQVETMLSLRGKVSVNKRTNVLIVTDVEPKLAQINDLIQSLDKQTPQVLIEARLVEASTNFTRSLGVQWGGNFFGVAGGTPTGMRNAAAGALQGRNYAVNFPATSQNPASLGFSLGSIGNMAVINARITAGENDGQAKTVSSPKIMTLDNKPARITQGTRVPYTVISNNTADTKFIEAALELSVVPHVTSDGSVQMTIKVTQNRPNFRQLNPRGMPTIIVKEAITELLVKDGDTTVIGGIYTREQNKSSRHVPWLGKVPVLGWLFKNETNTDHQTELLVFLTPRLMNREASTVKSGMKGDKSDLVNKVFPDSK